MVFQRAGKGFVRNGLDRWRRLSIASSTQVIHCKAAKICNSKMLLKSGRLLNVIQLSDEILKKLNLGSCLSAGSRGLQVFL